MKDIPSLSDFVDNMVKGTPMSFNGKEWIVRQVEQIPFNQVYGHTIQTITLTDPHEEHTQHILKIRIDVCKTSSTADQGLLGGNQ